MALKYKLELDTKNNSVYIHLRTNPPIFQDKISKEKYESLPLVERNKFLTTVLGIGGIIEVSTQSYLVWVMKAPTFEWNEILPTLLFEVSRSLGEKGEIEALEGSMSIDKIVARKAPSPVRKLVQGVSIAKI